ncbi:hypothetical protein Tco_0245922 [Tanacetum coccineum]
MAQLKYCDKHNQVGFLRKPDESAGFAEIVDFLRGSNLRYALTSNPTIYDSLVKQFWQTATANTIVDGTLEIKATIDTIGYTITEASIRDTLQLEDASGITMLPNNELFEGMGQMGYPTDGSFTFWKSFFTPQWRYLVHHLLHCISSKSGGWDQFGSNIATALICLSTGRVYNFSKLIFDGMVANLKSKTKFLMYPRFLQMILNIQTENKHLYLAVSLTKKIFGNMKRGFRGAPRPLLPAMLLVATNPIAGQEHDVVAQFQPSSSTPPVPSTSTPPVQSPPPIPATIPSPTPIPETDPEPFEHTFEEPSPVHQHFSPPQEQAQGQMAMDDLLQVVPQLISRIDSLETDLKQTKLTMGNAIVKLVKKVKKLEGLLKKRNVVLSDSEEEEPEAQGRKSQDDPLASLVQGLVTPSTTKVDASGEEQVEDIKEGDTREEKRLRERVSTVSTKKSTPSPDKGQREGKASHDQKSTEQQKKRKAQVQFEAQHYTDEDWDLIKAKIEANAELSKRTKTPQKATNRDEAKDDEAQQRNGLEKRRKKDGKNEVAYDLDIRMILKILDERLVNKKKSLSQQGEKGVYQIVREDGTDIVYINFGAMMKSISRDDLTELYRIVMNRYGMNGPEDELERVFWKYLKNMFEEPLSTDPIWSEVGQQKIISWRYYESCRVHCLNLESMDVYMLIERTYPLSAEMCKVMLDKKLQGGKPDENCYKMLKMMEKQAGIRK